MLVREGDGSSKGKFGISPAPASFVITDTLTPGLNAVLPASNACGLNGSGITIANEPYGAIGINGSTATNAVVNSGTITCSQAGAGGAVTITIAGADTTGSSFPVNRANGAGVDNLTYVVAGYLRLFVPDTGMLSGGGTPFGDTYTGIDPGEPDELAGNLTASVTLTAQGPAPAHGGDGKVFVQTTSENGFPFNNANGPALTAGVPIVAVFEVSNTSTPALGSAGLTNVLACDIIDTAHVRVTPYSGSAGFATDSLWGGAVHLSNINGGSFSDGSPPPGFAVLYGDSTVDQTCVSAVGFKASASDASFTAGNPITRVRFVTTSLLAVPTAQEMRVQLSETVVTPLAAGTIVNNDLTATASSSTGGAGISITAHTNGQIFQNTIAADKYMWATTAGKAVFNANGASGVPSATGASSGSNGLVDTNQEVVAALDDDASQGTLDQAGMVTCDIIPANMALKDFDGVTGPAVATWAAR